jgi:predicted dehydrogenase
MEPLRIGILGASRIAPNALFAPAALTGDHLVAVAARDQAKAEAYAAEHSIARVLSDYRAVIDDPEVEVIYNPLANGLHGPWNIEAMRAGKHVLSEKPSASTAAEAQRVLDVQRDTGVNLHGGLPLPLPPRDGSHGGARHLGRDWRPSPTSIS